MIPIEYHDNLFRQAKYGHKVDFVINRVPNSPLNCYIGRTGSIQNIRMQNKRIKWLDILVDSYGYGKCKLVSFPVDHITLIKPAVKKIYTNYQDYTNDNIVDDFPVEQDDDEPEEYDIYDDE
jgi:hypothetical protein